MRRIFFFLTVFPALALAAAGAGAQRLTVRPTLPRGSDLNDWEAYYDRGVELLAKGVGGEAWLAFTWAARLDPTRGEPPYGIRAALFLQDLKRFEEYMEELPEALADPVMIRADSLQREAFLRNPLVPRTVDVLVVDRLPGRWRDDRPTRAWLHYARGDIGMAARLLAGELEADPRRRYRQRYDLALVLVGLGRMDSAAVQVQALLDELRRRDHTGPLKAYESKDVLEYALGLLHLARKRYPEARAAMERALVENAGSYAARRGLGAVALAEGKPAEAVEHYGQALELAGEHPLLAFEYGRALAAAGRAADAVPHLERAVAREPHWADLHLETALAHDRAGNAREALRFYTAYLELAPRKAAEIAEKVRLRMEQLRAAGGA